jgi:hypothetical protein
MSTAFISGSGQHLPNATMTFDRYHPATKLGEAVDAVRHEEFKTRSEFKHTRWLWLKELREPVHGATPRTPPAYAPLGPTRHCPGAALARGLPSPLRPAPSYAPEYLRRWCYGAKHSRLQPVKDFVNLGREALGRHHCLAHQPPDQRPARRDQLLHPGSQSPRPRPQQNQDDHIVYLAAAKLQLPTVTSPTPAYMVSR